MRKSHRCPKCDHDRVLHITQVADRGGESSKHIDAEPAPLEGGHYFPWRLARVRNPDDRFLASHDAAAGLVEAYVCRKCGFTELYTRGVEHIEVDGALVRELRAPTGEGPFR